MLKIPQTIIDALYAHAIKQKPLECCGFLGANAEREVKVMIPAYNCDQSTMTFSIGPKAIEYAYRRCDEKGLDVVCIFHSHTESTPVPSIADVVQAENSIASIDPDFRWIIMGVRDIDHPTMHAYRISARNYVETAIEITD